ncbi:TIGR02234 family membrane protein [Embleya scabrispora]|uniref:TIGR02234 family membrane protein n=1 Tax=Embleya scabrispora TaxID=159449 RepID=UPI000380FDA9|nr:TIGR02234 family membrane protein [Embleya scabrispora]MYS86982.1 TIGR02234 family membrane protein [Streptomyces sp. SID5474]
MSDARTEAGAAGAGTETDDRAVSEAASATGAASATTGQAAESASTDSVESGALRARKAARRELTVAVLLALVGAALVLSVAGRTWAEGTAPVHGSRIAVHASGNTINKAVSALALLGLAGGLAVLATRTIGRSVIGALVTLAGIGVTVLAVRGASDTSAVNSEAAGKAAVEGVRAVDVSHTIWPWFAFVGGVLIVLAGLLVVLRGRRWPGMSNRYDAPAGKPVAAKRGSATNADLWNALDRGEDPTR